MAAAAVLPNIVVYTTLLKGYAAAGDVPGMQSTLAAMSAAEVKPDIRTVNTFMRGCVRVGDATAALDLFDQVSAALDPLCRPDATSFKYAFRLMAQTLQLKKLLSVLEEMQQADSRGDSGAWHNLNGLGNDVALHLDVATAAAISGNFQIAAEHLASASYALTGAARKNDALFDATRKEELRIAVAALEPFVEAAVPIEQLDSQFVRALLFSAQLNQADDETGKVSGAELAIDLATQLEQTFGLTQCGKEMVQSVRARLDRCVTKKGRLRWKRIFEGQDNKKSKKRQHEEDEVLPVRMEVCSGSGDWVVAQAVAEEGEANWVSMELRHDRVHAVWQKMVLQKASNMCVLGGDAFRVLRCHVAQGSVERVCVNFPEPPHWTGSSEADSKLHLLTAEFFKTAHRALQQGGGLTILSDNLQYCQSLATEIGRLTSCSGDAMFITTQVQPDAGMRGWHEDVESIRIYEGLPGKRLGHAVNASSQFDRFWESGSYTKRYFLAVDKVSVDDVDGTDSGENDKQSHSKAKKRAKKEVEDVKPDPEDDISELTIEQITKGIKAGDTCLAKHPEDDHWYPSEVQRVITGNGKENIKFVVVFSGSWDKVTLKYNCIRTEAEGDGETASKEEGVKVEKQKKAKEAKEESEQEEEEEQKEKKQKKERKEKKIKKDSEEDKEGEQKAKRAKKDSNEEEEEEEPNAKKQKKEKKEKKASKEEEEAKGANTSQVQAEKNPRKKIKRQDEFTVEGGAKEEVASRSSSEDQQHMQEQQHIPVSARPLPAWIQQLRDNASEQEQMSKEQVTASNAKQVMEIVEESGEMHLKPSDDEQEESDVQEKVMTKKKKRKKEKKEKTAQKDSKEESEENEVVTNEKKKSKKEKKKRTVSLDEPEESEEQAKEVDEEEATPKKKAKQEEKANELALPQDMGELLSSLGITQLTAQFEKEEIDIDALQMMEDGDLKELGVAMGPRKKLSKWISEHAK